MLWNNQIITGFVVLLITTCSYAQRDKLFFRNDYTYIEATRSFYKLHTIWRTYADAIKICNIEGASLFYPEDEEEANAVLEFWRRTNPVGYVTIAVTSFIAKGVFETSNGEPIAEVYHKWDAGQPDNANNNEDCVELRRDSTLHDVNCAHDRAFICKKTLSSLEWNDLCELPNNEYIFEKKLGKCYKLHTEPRTWQEAYYACHSESSYLAIVDTPKEANHLVTVIGNAPEGSNPDDFLREAVHLGFKKRARGTTSTTEEPTGEDEEVKEEKPVTSETPGCGFIKGKLVGPSCSAKKPFICEHDVIACDICEMK